MGTPDLEPEVQVAPGLRTNFRGGGSGVGLSPEPWSLHELWLVSVRIDWSCWTPSWCLRVGELVAGVETPHTTSSSHSCERKSKEAALTVSRYVQ